MNTLFFKYFIEVEQTKSITKAAENLFMAQPNLSKAIKETEDSLGYAVFERTSKGVIATQKGKEFLKYAHNIMNQLEKIEAIGTGSTEDVQSIKISIPRGSYIAHGFTNFAAGLDNSKAIDINVQETNSMQTINNIADGSATLGIVRYQTLYERYFVDFLNEKNLAYDPIWEFEYLILVSEKNRLATAEKVEYDKLSEFTEIVHGDTVIPYLNESTEDKTANIKKRIYVYERCNQFDLLSEIPTTFMWVSPIPASLIEKYKLVQRRCDVPGNKHKDILVYPKGYNMTALDRKFIDKLYEAKNQVAFNEYS